MAFFTEIGKDPQIDMKPQKTLTSVRKSNKAGGLILPDLNYIANQ